MRKKLKTLKLGVVRTVNPTIYLFRKKHYVKIREIAWLLEIKQQYDFTKSLKEIYGEDKILKGLETQSFRDATDNSKTTFVDLETLQEYFSRPDIRLFHHVNEKKLKQVSDAISSIL